MGILVGYERKTGLRELGSARSCLGDSEAASLGLNLKAVGS